MVSLHRNLVADTCIVHQGIYTTRDRHSLVPQLKRPTFSSQIAANEMPCAIDTVEQMLGAASVSTVMDDDLSPLASYLPNDCTSNVARCASDQYRLTKQRFAHLFLR